MKKVLLNDMHSDMYVELISGNESQCEPQRTLSEDTPKHLSYIVESSEQANEAFFSMLEADVEKHCSHDPCDDWETDYKELVKDEISREIHRKSRHSKAMFFQLFRISPYLSDRSIKYDGTATYQLEPFLDKCEDFLDWFKYSKWSPFFKFHDQTVSFNFQELNRVYKANQFEKGNEEDGCFLNEIQDGVIRIHRVEYMDGELMKRKIKVQEEINDLANKALDTLY